MGAIGILYLQGGFANIAAAGGGVGHALAAVVVFLGKGHAQILPGVSHGRPVMQVLYQTVLLHQEDEGGMLRFYGYHLPLHGGNGYGFMGEFFGFTGLGSSRSAAARKRVSFMWLQYISCKICRILQKRKKPCENSIKNFYLCKKH